jgi:DNA-binding transcriptional LysR family regulator
MNLTRLQTFVEVVRNGTFAGAAETLTFTPSAVSQQMAKLEAELGAPLLVRDARGVQLTPAGQLLHTRALVILSAVRDAELDIDALRSDRLSRLRLGSFPAATAGVVPRALRLFRRRLPSTEVELLEVGASGICDGRLDLALEARLEADADDDPGLTAVVLAREPLSLAMPTSHPLAARDTLELEALDGLLVVGSPHMPEVAELMRRCAAVGVEPALTGWRVPDPHALVQLAAAGEGLALVPALLADSAPPRTVLRRLEAGPRWELRVLRPAGDVVPVTTLAMIEALRVAATLGRTRPLSPVHAAA